MQPQYDSSEVVSTLTLTTHSATPRGTATQSHFTELAGTLHFSLHVLDMKNVMPSKTLKHVKQLIQYSMLRPNVFGFRKHLVEAVHEKRCLHRSGVNSVKNM